MIRGQLAPLSHALFSPNASYKNFEIAILLKIVQRSDNENSDVDRTPEPGDRHCNLCPWGIYGSCGRDARMNFREGSFD